MLVMGDVKPSEYEALGDLIEKIDKDDFSKKYFIGITKEKEDYNLLTSDGNYKVEIGDLDNIDLKVRGFKTFVEKYLVDQNTQKYKKISLKYDNQIVTTLNPYFKENDSILRNAPKIEIKKPEETQTHKLASTPIKKEVKEKKTEPKKVVKKAEPKKETSKPKKVEKKPEAKKVSTKKKETTSKTNDKKKKAKVVVE